MKSYKIASIAGDGIGKEVLPESLKILKEIASSALMCFFSVFVSLLMKMAEASF